MKIKTITIEFVGSMEKTTATRNEAYRWTFEGALYPRMLKFIEELNRIAKECDSSSDRIERVEGKVS